MLNEESRFLQNKMPDLKKKSATLSESLQSTDSCEIDYSRNFCEIGKTCGQTTYSYASNSVLMKLPQICEILH